MMVKNKTWNDVSWVFADKKFVRLSGKPYLWDNCQVFAPLLLPYFDLRWSFLIISQILFYNVN